MASRPPKGTHRRTVPDLGLPGEPAAPPIPSFESLRAPRRRTALDVLVPEATPAPPSPPPGRVQATRPPEYADLVRLGVYVLRAMAGASGRVALWSVGEPIRLLRRLRGD